MSKHSPEHIAIIMDGNGRWANQRDKNRTFGHSRGVEVAGEIVRASAEAGISTLTLFAFSTENKQRPYAEVSELTKLFADSLHERINELVENGVRLSFLGDVSFFESSFCRAIRNAELRTAALKRLQLNVAVNYSGRWDIANAVSKALKAGTLNVDTQTAAIESLLPDYLNTGEIDLLIRTGGECRLSNFLLWQSAYAELYFTDTLWPDFCREKYEAALEWYASRERRFGMTSAQVQYSALHGSR